MSELENECKIIKKTNSDQKNMLMATTLVGLLDFNTQS